jgi:hypothetical protein
VGVVADSGECTARAKRWLVEEIIEQIFSEVPRHVALEELENHTLHDAPQKLARIGRKFTRKNVDKTADHRKGGPDQKYYMLTQRPVTVPDRRNRAIDVQDYLRDLQPTSSIAAPFAMLEHDIAETARYKARSLQALKAIFPRNSSTIARYSSR